MCASSPHLQAASFYPLGARLLLLLDEPLSALGEALPMMMVMWAAKTMGPKVWIQCGDVTTRLPPSYLPFLHAPLTSPSMLSHQGIWLHCIPPPLSCMPLRLFKPWHAGGYRTHRFHTSSQPKLSGLWPT